MVISKDEALQFALAFAAREFKESKVRLCPEDAKVRVENTGFGYSSLGMSKVHWSVLIPIKSNDPSVAAIDPDFVIALVSDDGSKTCWFPVM